MNISLSPSRLRMWSRETDSAAPSCVSLLILHTRAEAGAYLRDFSRVPRWRPFIYLDHHTPSGQSRVNRVKHLRTDGVHCLESASTGPVVLKVVPAMDAAFAGHHGLINVPLSFSHTYYWRKVGMWKVSVEEMKPCGRRRWTSPQVEAFRNHDVNPSLRHLSTYF